LRQSDPTAHGVNAIFVCREEACVIRIRIAAGLAATAIVAAFTLSTPHAKALGSATGAPTFGQHLADAQAVGVTALDAYLPVDLSGADITTDTSSSDAIVVSVLSNGPGITGVSDSRGNSSPLPRRTAQAAS